MTTPLSVADIKAVAEAAVTARFAADAAKKAHEEAPDDESLKAAYTSAESAATAAKAKADALSQESKPPLTPAQIAKKKRKIQILRKELGQNASEDEGDDDIDDEEEDLDDPDRPLTHGDLQRIEANKAKKTTEDMAEAITDPVAKAQVKAALAGLVLTGDPTADFKRAVAIANIEKNSKVLEELQRTPPRVQHASGPGSPPKPPEQEFVPTAEEQRYMGKPFNLSKEAIIAARAAAAPKQ